MLVRFWFYLHLGVPRRLRFVGGEHFSCELQIALNIRCGRVRAAKHAPRHPFRLLERRHGLADIVERGAGVAVRPV